MIQLSIITPTYNRAALLEKNIQSVMAQDFQPIEHLIIDNLSQDGTEELVRDYAKQARYPVVYIREKDRGIYQAMNKGIRKARGKWLHFLNSDDRYADRTVLAGMLAPDRDQYDIVCGGIIHGQSLEQGKYYPSYYDQANRYHAFQHQASFIKKSFFDAHGLYNERYRIHADGLYNAKYYPQAKYLIVDKPVAIMEPGGISSVHSVRMNLEYAAVMVLYRKFPLGFKANCLKELAKTIIVKTFFPNGINRKQRTAAAS